MKISASIIAVSLAGALAAASADAAILNLATRDRPFHLTSTPAPVPLRDDGADAILFRTLKDDTLVTVTFQTECTGIGAVGDRIELWFNLDGVARLPSFTLCSITTEGVYTPFGASRRLPVRVPKAGRHTIRAVARTTDGVVLGELDDSSIVIED